MCCRRMVVGLSLALSCLCACAAAADEEAEERNVESLARQYLAMVRTEDPTPLETVEEMLAEDFIQSTSHGTVVKGREENVRWIGKALSEIRDLFNAFDYRLDVQTVRVYGQSALVFGKVELSGELKESRKPFQREIWETMVFVGKDGKWKLVHEHSTRVKSD